MNSAVLVTLVLYMYYYVLFEYHCVLLFAQDPVEASLHKAQLCGAMTPKDPRASNSKKLTLLHTASYEMTSILMSTLEAFPSNSRKSSRILSS